jgi:hypothetical protein
MVFKNRILRKILGPKMGEIGGLGNLHNDLLNKLYYS